MDYDPTKPGWPPKEESFQQELGSLLNKYSQENASNTPDFVLAGYLTECLKAWNIACEAREKWYGRTGTAPATIADQEELMKLVREGVEKDETQS